MKPPSISGSGWLRNRRRPREILKEASKIATIKEKKEQAELTEIHGNHCSLIQRIQGTCYGEEVRWTLNYRNNRMRRPRNGQAIESCHTLEGRSSGSGRQQAAVATNRPNESIEINQSNSNLIYKQHLYSYVNKFFLNNNHHHYQESSDGDEFSGCKKVLLLPQLLLEQRQQQYNKQKNPIKSVILVILTLLLTLLLLHNQQHLVPQKRAGYTRGRSSFSLVVSAYQLTNNLIANNLPPKFITSSGSSNSEIVVRVKEGPASIGKLICTLKGEDSDEDPLTFGVLGTTASDLLRIENVPGNHANVYLRKELDRETTQSHQVVITLTDGKLGRGNWVEDVNDNNPIFGPHRTAISVREDAKVPMVIETIEATDQDEGRFGQVIYKLDESLDDSTGNSQRSSIGNIFSIETIDGKGVISLISPLDYEQRALYQLRILATDRAIETERLTTSTSILISVEDCEDQAPMFTFVPSITRIPESLQVGSPVVRVTAVDGDRGINNKISYKILTLNGQDVDRIQQQLFLIDSDSGQIIVGNKLDRESSDQVGGWFNRKSADQQQPGSYVLQVRASELNSSRRDSDSSVTTELTILLTDVNDELPTFNQNAYFGEILENSAPESLVSFIAKPTSQLQQQLQQQPSDNQQYYQLLQAKVIDRDQGTNGTFTLKLEGEHSRFFEIWPREATNEASFMIKISPNLPPSSEAFLDFERRKEFTFTLVAREKYSHFGDGENGNELRFSSAQMTVFIRDTNDNYPQFEQELYKVEIPENAIKGMHVCQVKASDIDSYIYGTEGIRYTEIRGEKANKFKLDPLTGVVTLKTSEHGFDREIVAQHHLIIEARDNNGQGNRNTTQLLIQLTDINDQAPKFLLDQYEAFIYENELDFQSPLQVQAIDNDLVNTANSKLTYSIISGDPQQNFTIEQLTGRIRIRTRQQQLLLNTTATRTNSINEELLTENVETNGGLDFERIAQKRDDTRQFNLTIKATDSGIPEQLSDTTNVIIIVYDKNDHAPVFTRPVYHKSIREDAKEGSQVVQVLAQDGDHSPTNSKISYRISSGGSDKFVIDSDNGLISVANGANLDIDRVVGGQKRTNYLLSVIASDGSFGLNQKSSSALVNITIIDVNNKPPEFTTLGAVWSSGASFQLTGAIQQQQTTLPPGSIQQQQQQFMVVHVNEDAPYGLIVTKVVATDLDSSADLRYSINYARSEARNEDMQLVDPILIRDIFSIEPNDGMIKVAKPLDRETFDQVKLRLQVEDIAAQTPDQVAYAYLLIKITDINDNSPIFKKPLYKAVVNENSISGTSIITLTADDRDLNKTLRYSLEGAPEVMRLIRINSRSGEVMVNDKIDREIYSLINVTVKAEDFGPPHSLTGSTQLLITIRDENDNNPTFLDASQLIKGHPNQLSGRRLDIDNSQPTTDRPFPSNLIPKNHNMERANETSYQLRSLTDRSPDVMGRVDVGLEPIVLEEPSSERGTPLPLLSPGSTARVSEDASVGQQLAYVRAEDSDVGNNGRVTYLLDAVSSGGKFRIDRDTGVISVAGQLDRETVKQYSLIIEACDNYDLGYSTGESRRAFTQVNILVTDINDNAPVIRTNLQTSSAVAAVAAAAAAAASFSANQPVPDTLATDVAPEPFIGPNYDEVMSSPGPYDMPLSECLFISEFQPINEPILTITATDADDPNTPNGQIELATVNNLPQNELFGLITISNHGTATTMGSTVPPTTTLATNDLSNKPSDQFLGFGELSLGESAPKQSIAVDSVEGEEEVSERSQKAQSHKRPKRSEETLVFGSQSGNSHRTSRSRPPTIRLQHPRSQPRTFTNQRVSPTQVPQFTNATTGLPPALVMSATISSVSQTNLNRYSHGNSQNNADAGEQQVHVVVLQSLKERVGNYSILVRATDKASPALSSVKLINICVQDINNHAPVFLRPPLNYTIKIQENSTIGSFVTQVEATDADHGLNGELQYSLKPSNTNNDWQSFKIDRLSGVISTAKLFNRQLKKYYTIRVQAQDYGKPTTLSNDIDLNIMVINSGQYQPEFNNQIQQLIFTENIAPGVEWFTILPTTNLDDNPSLINANILKLGASSSSSNIETEKKSAEANWLAIPCYFIVDSDDREHIFHLDRYTHHLTNQKIIDREKKHNYTLIVQATNNCAQAPASPFTLTRLVPSDDLTSGKKLDSISTGVTSKAPLPQQIDYRSSLSDSGSLKIGGSDTNISIRQRRSISNNKVTELSRPLPISGSQLLTTKSPDYAPDRFTSAALDTMLANDKSLLKVVIKIKDVNDNPPKFSQKIYTGGITTETDFGTVFMIVQAIDSDAEQNAQVVYSLVKPIKRNMMNPSGLNSTYLPVLAYNNNRTSTLNTHSHDPKSSNQPLSQALNRNPSFIDSSSTNGESGTIDLIGSSNNDIATNEGEDLFLINPQTGEISLNFEPQKYMKGYFEFEVMANDTDGLYDLAKVFIYLLRQDQRVKFVLRLTLHELRQRLDKFREVIGNITGAIANIDSYQYFENQDGTVDKKKTSLYLHFVKPDDNTIIEVDKVLTLIENSTEYLNELYKEFHVLSSEAAQLPLSQSALIDPNGDQVRAGLMGVSSFLALILILVIALFLNQRSRYERQLKAATVSAFGSGPFHLNQDFQDQTNLPNTNLYSQDPNPIWANGYNDQDWLSGNNSEGSDRAINNTHSNTNRKSAKGDDVNMGIEDADYLSSENSDSLSGCGGASVPYNNTTTATPRDSLNSSQGRVSGSAGSSSTTDERQALCNGNSKHNNNNNNNNNVKRNISRDSGLMVAGVLKNGKPLDQSQLQKRPSSAQRMANNADTRHSSTFGAFKEVTIYTEQQLEMNRKQQDSRHQLLSISSPNGNKNNLIRNINNEPIYRLDNNTNPKQQANRIDMQLNQKKLPASNQMSNGNKGNGPSQVYIGQHQQHRIVVQANGTDPSHGIIKTGTGSQALPGALNSRQPILTTVNLGKQNNNTKLVSQQQSSYYHGDHHHQEANNITTDNIDTNLNKLSILNLETTEL